MSLCIRVRLCYIFHKFTQFSEGSMKCLWHALVKKNCRNSHFTSVLVFVHTFYLGLWFNKTYYFLETTSCSSFPYNSLIVCLLFDSSVFGCGIYFLLFLVTNTNNTIRPVRLNQNHKRPAGWNNNVKLCWDEWSYRFSWWWSCFRNPAAAEPWL